MQHLMHVCQSVDRDHSSVALPEVSFFFFFPINSVFVSAFLSWIKGLRTEDVVHCKAHWGSVIVIWGFINKMIWIDLQSDCRDVTSLVSVPAHNWCSGPEIKVLYLLYGYMCIYALKHVRIDMAVISTCSTLSVSYFSVFLFCYLLCMWFTVHLGPELRGVSLGVCYARVIHFYDKISSRSLCSDFPGLAIQWKSSW